MKTLPVGNRDLVHVNDADKLLDTRIAAAAAAARSIGLVAAIRLCVSRMRLFS